MKLTGGRNPPRWIWDETLAYAKDCQILFHDVHLPYYLSSVGAHIANLRNRSRQFFGRTGEFADLRLHTLIIAPPGFSKSFLQNFLFNPRSGVIAEPCLPSKDISFTTEAALVGSFDENGDEVEGSAKEKWNGFLYTDELSSVLNQTQTTHSKNMLDALLRILDRGQVSKPMKQGSIKYETCCTAVFGTQQERLDVRSGLDRRLFILDCTPNSHDRDLYFDAFVAGTGVAPDMERVTALRDATSILFRDFDIDKMVIDPALYRFCKKLGMAHTDLIMFERLAVGYSVFNSWDYGIPVLKVVLDSQLEGMIERAWKWRKAFREEGLQIIKLIDERDWGTTELKNFLVRPPFSIRWEESGNRIDRLLRREFLSSCRKTLTGAKKPTTFLARGPQWPY